MSKEIIIECKKCHKNIAEVIDYTKPMSMHETNPHAVVIWYCPECKIIGYLILNPFLAYFQWENKQMAEGKL